MSAAGGYRNCHFSGVDGKARFTLPPDLRHRVRAGSEEQNLLHLQIIDGAPFMVGFGSDYLDVLAERAKAEARVALERGLEFDAHRLNARTHGNVVDINFDDGGRFALPLGIGPLMGISEHMFFVGANDTFEIWAPERFLESDLGTEFQRMQCRALLGQSRAKRSRRGDA